MICEKSTTRLIKISRELRDVHFDALPLGRMSGVSDAQTQFGLCHVNRRLAEAQRGYSVVAIRNKDDARYQDTIAPTIRRDYGDLAQFLGHLKGDLKVRQAHVSTSTPRPAPSPPRTRPSAASATAQNRSPWPSSPLSAS